MNHHALILLLGVVAYAQSPVITQGRTDKPAVKVSKSVFHIMYVGHDAVYIDGGSADGLVEGMALEISRRPTGTPLVDTKTVGTGIIRAVATHSAVCELQKTILKAELGDQVRLSAADEAARARAEVGKESRKYLQVIEFDGSDPLEEEQRAYVPRPKVKETARMRGSIAFERSDIIDHDSSSRSSQNGAVVRVDWHRIDGTYWSIVGYWRGSLTSSSGSQTTTTLLDLYSRTYQIGIFYANPQARWNLGVGRLFVPGATSLGVVDGGYLTRRFSKSVSATLFAGSDPDPTQWNYEPNRQTAGALLRFETGSLDAEHYTGSFGVALTRVNWRPERQYIFAENTFSIGRAFTLFQSIQADQRNPKLMNGATGAQLSQSFTTVRLQPFKRLGFDLNHNYFRGLPTFDQRLIGTGLLDQYLFTGFSGGVRLEPFSRLLLTGTWGQSRKNGDTSHSVNQFYDAAWKRLPWIDTRIDVRYNKFNSSFGSGSYQSLALSKQFFEKLRVELEGGVQEVRSNIAAQGRSRYLNSLLDWQLAQHYFATGGLLFYRGQTQNYDQIYFSLGYRLR